MIKYNLNMTILKKEIIFGVLGSLAVIFLMFYYVWKYKSINSAFLLNQQVRQNASISSNQVVSTSGIVMISVNLTAEEVKKHVIPSDCWMIINGNVYDVSNYDVNHPGGAYRIDSYCGADATLAFNTMDGKGSHSSFANQLLAGMLLGTLNGQVDSKKVQDVKTQNIQNIQNTQNTQSTRNEREDD
jgi:cytochrome b involved in lipid metabolism